jgi:CO/xanthine dehydrogenase FAD-binding subunit
VLVSLPVSLEEAFDAFERCPDAQLLAGGTDFMVEVNFALRRPPAVVCLRKVEELKGWRLEGSEVVLGAGLTYTELMAPRLSDLVPGLVQASRTVGSPQIRNAGTLGGNLGTASPAGDSLPVLAALDAKIVVASKQGRRSLELDDLIVGPKRTTLGPGEVIVEIRFPPRWARRSS